MILEQIFKISILTEPKNNGLIFMGKHQQDFFAVVQDCKKQISPIIQNKNSRVAYDSAKDWFNSQFDGFIKLEKTSQEEFKQLSKIFPQLIRGLS